jgi:outer membrane scaffolding protein for murein synthesis (MipA/OmpV family)
MKQNGRFTQRFKGAVLTGAILSGAIGAAHAADMAYETPPAAPEEAALDNARSWAASIGVGALVAPEYEGSDKFKVSPIPLIDLRWKTGWVFADELFISTEKGIGANLFTYGGFKLGAAGNYDFGRDEDDGDRLRGLGDIDGGATAAVFASQSFGAFEVNAEFKHYFEGTEGNTVTVGAAYGFLLTEKWGAKLQASAQWADSDYMQGYFGVSSPQAARSGLAQYDAGSGFKSIDISAAGNYQFTEKWSLTHVLGAKFLVGDAKDSPIVEQEVQPYAVLGVSYKF